MNKQYQIFEEGFIKGAVAQGVEESFMRGYLKQAQEMTNTWMPYLELGQKLDPQFKVKLAADLILAGNKGALEKSAFDMPGMGNIDVMGLLDQLGGSLGGSSGLGGLLAGGGGGALVGLLLAKVLGLPSWAGLLLGATGGGLAGKSYGEGNLFEGQQQPPSAQNTMNLDKQMAEGTGPYNPTPVKPLPTSTVSSMAPENTTPTDQQLAGSTPETNPIVPPSMKPAPASSQMQGPLRPVTPAPLPPIKPDPAPTPDYSRGLGAGEIPMRKKRASLNMDAMIADKISSIKKAHDIDPQTIALLQQMLGSQDYQQNALQGNGQAVPQNSRIEMAQPYNKDQGALQRLKDMGAGNPEELMNPPKPKFNISQAFNSTHGSQQHVNSSMSAPAQTQKPMQQAKPGPLGFPGSNIQQGSQQLQKNTQQSLKASV